ncbi:MAG: hypothetical protein IK115_05520 [Lachnospiraceae bacterium]|nr:hypothetical protein [Lachnospiraceae bacterium]
MRFGEKLLFAASGSWMRQVYMDKKKKKLITDLLAILLGALFLECFVFNFRHWLSRANSPIEVPLKYCSYTGEAEWQEDGSVVLTRPEEETGCLVAVNLEGLGVEMTNIAVEIACTDPERKWTNYMREDYMIQHSPMVRATTILNLDGQREDNPGSWLLGAGNTEYIQIPQAGEVDAFGLFLEPLMGSRIRIGSITLNANQRMCFLPLRFLAVLFFMLFVYAFLPGSVLWRESLLEENGKLRKKYLAAFGIVAILLLILINILLRQSLVYMSSEGGFHPYTDLARAFAHGHLYLDEEPTPELKAMEDPYDLVERMEKEVHFRLDYAYYNEKYYIYFGVVPCLLLYLPWYLISGTDLPGYLVMPFMLWLCYIGAAFLLHSLIRRYARGTSAATAILLWMGAAAGLSLPQAMGDATNYYAPMLPAAFFFFLGMSLNLSAADRLEAGERKGGTLRLVLGSLCMALIAGCRPNLVLGAVCTVPVLLPLLFPKKEEKRRPDLKLCLAFALPYAAVAAGLMLYNALRFGSPFDFGAMKNMTFAFLTTIQPSVAVLGAGLFYYLIRPVTFMGRWPYLNRTSFKWSNPNLLASHDSVGGLFMLYPVLLLGLCVFLPQKGKDAKSRELAWIGRMGFLLVPLMAMLTAQMGGLVDRYRIDMSPFAGLALICGGLLLRQFLRERSISEKQRKLLQRHLLFFFVAYHAAT